MTNFDRGCQPLAKPFFDDVARCLRTAYAASVTARMGLEGQNADQDAEITQCLHRHVCDPMGFGLERIDSLIEEELHRHPHHLKGGEGESKETGRPSHSVWHVTAADRSDDLPINRRVGWTPAGTISS